MHTLQKRYPLLSWVKIDIERKEEEGERGFVMQKGPRQGDK